MKKKRIFSVEQKMQILREAEEHGMLATCRKYEIAQSLYYRWKNQFDQKGIDGLQGQYYRVDPRVRELERENERLKKIIARQALELEVKSELLKKTQQLNRRRDS
jgi:transposase-like protein